MRRARAACGPCAAEGAPVTKELSKRSEVVLASVPTGVRVPHFSTQFVDLRTDRRARSPFLNPVRRPPYRPGPRPSSHRSAGFRQHVESKGGVEGAVPGQGLVSGLGCQRHDQAAGGSTIGHGLTGGVDSEHADP